MTDPTPNLDELWLAREVARFTKLSERTIFTMTANGTLRGCEFFVAEVARLQISSRNLNSCEFSYLISSHPLPAIRIGRSVRYRPAAVLEALRKLEGGVAQ